MFSCGPASHAHHAPLYRQELCVPLMHGHTRRVHRGASSKNGRTCKSTSSSLTQSVTNKHLLDTRNTFLTVQRIPSIRQWEAFRNPDRDITCGCPYVCTDEGTRQRSSEMPVTAEPALCICLPEQTSSESVPRDRLTHSLNCLFRSAGQGSQWLEDLPQRHHGCHVDVLLQRAERLLQCRAMASVAVRCLPLLPSPL